MTVLQVRQITRSFGELKAVDAVSFEVGSGEICGFIGPNGAGKTTTMRICSTLDVPDSGDVLVNGVSVLDDPAGVRRRIGFMPDNFPADPNTPVADFLDFKARARGLRGAARRRAIRDVVEFTGLSDLIEKNCDALSKGMRQRTGLAATLLHDPDLLILDEPAAGLDPRARIELRELLKALGEMGKAVLISSHILSELGEICDVVAVIEQGKLKAAGAVDGLSRSVSGTTTMYLRTLSPVAEVELRLAEQRGVSRIRPRRDGLVFELEGGDEERAVLLRALVEAGLRPTELAAMEVGLEQLFLSLTEGRVQ